VAGGGGAIFSTKKRGKKGKGSGGQSVGKFTAEGERGVRVAPIMPRGIRGGDEGKGLDKKAVIEKESWCANPHIAKENASGRGA